ncbi:MAG TPA: triose-phosphate isomerase [Ignavibacteria bacterium]|nr:triose-phosphate isomerase [Ignavibacteria bacterium]HMQ98728.1 triose-phosphate isomerase [Ignavibacteria bacterium]
MPHKKLIVANWKMNKGLVQSQQFADELKLFSDKHKLTDTEVVLCPPFTSLDAVNKKINGTQLKLGAQNMYFESIGAFTGEISAGMLKSCGCEYVILGHSERRQYFNETNSIINKKVLKALDEGLKPIVCLGENLQEHEDKLTESVIEEQLSACLTHVSEEGVVNVTIAYEPVWAIGTGKNATPHQVESAHNFLRKKLKKMYNEEVSKNTRIIYGGSVTPENAKELFASQTVNGGLIGGASLEAEKFIKIINSSNSNINK